MRDRWTRYKKTDDFRVQVPQSVQDIIEIKSIADNGIFEIGTGGVYTKTYGFTDINYATSSDKEQEAMLDTWCRWLNTNHEQFKITLNNKNRDMKKMRKDVLFDHAEDGLDDLRDAYNDIIETNLQEGRQGMPSSCGLRQVSTISHPPSDLAGELSTGALISGAPPERKS